MPVEARVVALSGSESSGSDAAAAAAVVSNKRKRGKESQDKSSEPYLKALLGRGGKCRKACMAQFDTPETLASLLEYRKHWFALEKVDQDNHVPWPSLLACFDIQYANIQP